MNLLLDTHILLWALASPERLPKAAITATQLPQIHKDPFDRILIAQAHNKRCHLVTVDSKITQYQMPYLWVV